MMYVTQLWEAFVPWLHTFMTRWGYIFLLVGAAFVCRCLILYLFRRSCGSQHGVDVQKKTRTPQEIGRSFALCMAGPFSVLPFLGATFFVHLSSEFPSRINELLVNVERSFLVLVVFWLLFNLTGLASRRSISVSQNISSSTLAWIFKLLRGIVFTIGLAVLLDVWGVNIGAGLTSMGILGVAAALGAQDLLKNLTAGMLILSERRFKVGDYIEIPGTIRGIVMDIGFRSTTVQQLDRTPIYIPNSKFSENAVFNFRRRKVRTINWTIALEYQSTTEQLRQIKDALEMYIKTCGDFLDDRKHKISVSLVGFSESSIDLRVRAFASYVSGTKWSRIREDLIFALKEIVEKSETGFAFPSMSIYTRPNNDTHAHRTQAEKPNTQSVGQVSETLSTTS